MKIDELQDKTRAFFENIISTVIFSMSSREGTSATMISRPCLSNQINCNPPQQNRGFAQSTHFIPSHGKIEWQNADSRCVYLVALAGR